MEAQNLLSTSEASEILGANERWVRRLVAAGRLEARKIGRDYVISRKDLEEFARVERQRGRPRSDSKSDSNSVDGGRRASTGGSKGMATEANPIKLEIWADYL